MHLKSSLTRTPQVFVNSYPPQVFINWYPPLPPHPPTPAVNTDHSRTWPFRNAATRQGSFLFRYSVTHSSLTRKQKLNNSLWSLSLLIPVVDADDWSSMTLCKALSARITTFRSLPVSTVTIEYYCEHFCSVWIVDFLREYWIYCRQPVVASLAKTLHTNARMHEC